jgi:hypothetical protein
MASLDTRRPAGQEQLAHPRRAVEGRDAADRQGPEPGADRQARRGGGASSAAMTSSCSTPPAALHIDEELMAEAAAVRDIAKPHETLLVADALTGQDAVNSPEAFDEQDRHHRHRADPHRRRRPRRRGAVDARRHRQADQADRHRRKDGRARGLPSRAHRRPHPRHGRHRQPRREGRENIDEGEGQEDRRRR